METRNYECANGVATYRSEGRTLFSKRYPTYKGKGCRLVKRIEGGYYLSGLVGDVALHEPEADGETVSTRAS